MLPSRFNRLYKDQFTEQNTIVIESNGTILGYSVFFDKHYYYEIDSVYISPDVRGKGLGKKLMDATELEIKARGAERIKLCAMTTGNEAKLIDYYQHLGYVLLNDNIMEKNI